MGGSRGQLLACPRVSAGDSMCRALEHPPHDGHEDIHTCNHKLNVTHRQLRPQACTTVAHRLYQLCAGLECTLTITAWCIVPLLLMIVGS